ncbi:VCBS domain-containing protein [Vibrio chagasii]|nr:VCBS domain-containing protein [Vibrio chagasii]
MTMRAKRPFTAQTDTAGSYGTFNIGTDGVWTYSLNNDPGRVQELGDGDTLTEPSQDVLGRRHRA